MGASRMYPENTLLAFEKASVIEELTGIGLNIQLTEDGHMVVFRDEKIDRTTNETGEPWDYRCVLNEPEVYLQR